MMMMLVALAEKEKWHGCGGKIAVQKPRIFSSIFMLKIDQNVDLAGFVATPLLIFNRSLKDA